MSEAGALYLARVQTALDDLETGAEEARALSVGPTGVLRVTASVTFGVTLLAPLVPELRAAMPHVGLDLELTDGNLDLVANRIDLAIRLAPSYRRDVVGVKAFDVRYCVCAATAYLASAPRIETPADLSAHRCVLFSLPQFRSRWLFRDRAGALTEVAIGGDIVISTPLSSATPTRHGLGPALLPHWLVADDLRTGALVDLFSDHDVTATDFTTAAWLLYPSRTAPAAENPRRYRFFQGAAAPSLGPLRLQHTGSVLAVADYVEAIFAFSAAFSPPSASIRARSASTVSRTSAASIF